MHTYILIVIIIMIRSNNKEQNNISNNSLIKTNAAYIHWIHCNQCYEQYIKKTRKFYLLACDHVCCEGCAQNISETTVNGPQIFKCSLCSRSTRGCRLGNDMSPHLKELFHPEPYLDGLNSYRIMVFQEKHRKRFMEYLDRQFAVIQDRKKDVVRIKEQAKANYQKMRDLKSECKQLEKRVIVIKHQRRELEEKRKSKRSSISDASSHSSGSKKLPARSNVNIGGITSFSHHTSNNSFLL